jgi:hypothetical protein
VVCPWLENYQVLTEVLQKAQLVSKVVVSRSIYLVRLDAFVIHGHQLVLFEKVSVCGGGSTSVGRHQEGGKIGF